MRTFYQHIKKNLFNHVTLTLEIWNISFTGCNLILTEIKLWGSGMGGDEGCRGGGGGGEVMQ